MAETTIDSLQIEINAKAQKANDAIDVLVDKLDVLSNSLGKINGLKLNGFAESLNSFKGSKIPDFTRLANGIKKLSQINYAEIELAGNSVRQIADQLQSLKEVKLDDNVMQISNVANAMSRLGGKSIVNATANVPLLANALNQLMVTLSKAPTVNQSVIDMTNALANLASQGSKVGSASKSVVNGLNRTNAAAKRASSSTMSLARAFGKFYANYFLLVRGFKGLFKSMESAMELTETVNYFEVTLRNIGESARENWKEYGYESADAYADSFAERLRESNEKLTGFAVSETGQISQSVFSGLGINPATATQYSAMFAQVANSIGMTEEASIALSEAFVRLGADWASLRNVDFEVAYEKLASGLAGQSRALRAFGVDITMATLQEIAFANGIEKSVSEMTQAEKAYLRLIAIIEQSEVAFGDLANTLESPANQMRMLSQGVKNLATLTGNLFLPIMSKALPILNGFVIAMQRIVIAISEAMGIDTSGFNTSLGGMTDNFENVSGGIDEATESAEKFNRATRGWDELNVLGKDTSKGYGVGNDLVENEELMKAYDDAIEKYRKAWNEAYKNINNEAEDFADKLLGKLNVDKIANDFSKLADSVGKIWEAISPAFGGFASEFIGTTFDNLNTILDFFSGVVSIFGKDTAKTAGEFLGVIVSNLLLFKGIKSIASGFSSAADGLTKIAISLSSHPILTTVGIGAVVATNLANVFNAIKDYIATDDMIEGYENFSDEIERQTQAFIDWDEASEKATNTPSELQLAYEKWNSIVSKVGELTEGEKALIKVYADQIKKLLPEANKLIGENGLAYEGAKGKLQELIDKQLELYRIQALETRLKDLMKMEVDLQFNISDLEEERRNFFNEIVKNFAPDFDITKIANYDLLTEAQRENNALVAIYDELYDAMMNYDAGSGGFFRPISPSDFDAIADFNDFYANMQEYFEMVEAIEEQQNLYKETQKKIEDVAIVLTETQEDVNNATEEFVEDTKKETKELSNLEKKIMEITFYLQDMGVELGTIYENAKENKDPIDIETSENTKKAAQAITALYDIFEKLNGKKYSTEFEVNVTENKKENNSLLGNIFGFLKGKLPFFATGGFPEDGLFMANHSELVGKFSNGKTAVANNAQITQGIEEASYRGMMRALQNANIGSRATFEIVGDPNGMFRVMQKQANQYTKSTGRNAFGY